MWAAVSGREPIVNGGEAVEQRRSAKCIPGTVFLLVYDGLCFSQEGILMGLVESESVAR